MPCSQGLPSAPLARFLGIVACAFVAIACDSGPDIVATGSATDPDGPDGGPFSNLPLIKGCSPGHFEGRFNSTADSDGTPSPIALDGTIGFSLEQLKAGEFLTLANDAPLTGRTDNLTFEGVIRGGRACVDGAFQSTIEDGKIFINMTNTPLPFEGTVNGTYYADVNAFRGEWRVEVIGTFSKFNGTWNAIGKSRK